MPGAPQPEWQITRLRDELGSDASLSNIAAGDALGVKTPRLGLRSDTLGIGQ